MHYHLDLFFDPIRNLQNSAYMYSTKSPQHPKSGAGGSAPPGVPTAAYVTFWAPK